MVEDELRELTNKLNGWHELLRRWDVWNSVVQRYSAENVWEIRREFVEALAHWCLIMPSSFRDTLTFVATNSMHQVRLAISNEYPDYLEGDRQTPDEKQKYLNRRQKEERLGKLISIWPDSSRLMKTIQNIDSRAYRDATSDYRNRNMHSIGPRLGIGMTRAVVRSVSQATALSRQLNGTYEIELVPEKMCVSYSFAGTAALDLREAFEHSLKQYCYSRDCYRMYRELLAGGLDAIPKNV